jgi:hypothetical protein
MAGFTSYDDIINELTVNDKGLDWSFMKAGPAAQAAGEWVSLFAATGNPGAGANPAATPGTAWTDVDGSIKFPDTTPDTKHILTFGAASSVSCSLMLVDRLCGVGSIVLTPTGNKTINSLTLPRYASGQNVEAWLEVTTATTTTPAVLSINSYTNEAGVAARVGTTVTMPAAATVLRHMERFPLQAGDKGVRAVSTVNVATAAAAGQIAVILLRPLVTIPIIANTWNERDLVLQLAALPRVYDGASLALMQLATATTATNHWGQVRLAYG